MYARREYSEYARKAGDDVTHTTRNIDHFVYAVICATHTYILGYNWEADRDSAPPNMGFMNKIYSGRLVGVRRRWVDCGWLLGG